MRRLKRIKKKKVLAIYNEERFLVGSRIYMTRVKKKNPNKIDILSRGLMSKDSAFRYIFSRDIVLGEAVSNIQIKLNEHKSYTQFQLLYTQKDINYVEIFKFDFNKEYKKLDEFIEV